MTTTQSNANSDSSSSEIAKITEDIKKLNSNLPQEKINNIMELINPSSSIVSGEIVNILYLENNNALEAIAISSDTSFESFIVAANDNVAPEAIQVKNLDDYCSRLEAAFNFGHTVHIRVEYSRIVSLVSARSSNRNQGFPILENRNFSTNSDFEDRNFSASSNNRPPCCFISPYCNYKY